MTNMEVGMMRWKLAGVLMCALSLLGCNDDVEMPTTTNDHVIGTSSGKVAIQNAVRHMEEGYFTADVVGEGFHYTLRLAPAGDNTTVFGGVAELRDESDALLFSMETLVNRETGEITFNQATAQDYLSNSIVTVDERVVERFDANGDVATFEYPLLSDENRQRAANYYKHGLPASRLPGHPGEFVNALAAFAAYYEPHSTSTLHDNASGLLLVQILTSSELPPLATSGTLPEDKIWKEIQATCAAARACQGLMCHVNPSGLACFTCTVVSVACVIVEFIGGIFGWGAN
jgi:hypothetical protein